jgi:hypothetical protein
MHHSTSQTDRPKYAPRKKRRRSKQGREMGSKPLIVCKKKERKGHVYTINRIGVFLHIEIWVSASTIQSTVLLHLCTYLTERKKHTGFILNMIWS